MSSLGLEPGI